jgi:DMSO/TMAO reductase YedYZ molybdopterin-dependent catalytic subunit
MPSQTPTTSTAPTSIYPGEVTQYQGQNLTPINGFIEDIDQHPDVALMGTLYLNQSSYRLTVTGLVNNTLEYTYDDVVDNFSSYQQVVTLLCVEGWSVTGLWQGVSVYSLLQAAGISSNATTIIFYAPDGYSTSLPLDYIVQNNIILAYKMNNVTLPATLGWPFMLIAQNQYGYKWIKWVTEIDASNDSSYQGYWESRGYPNNAIVTGDPNSLTLQRDSVLVVEAIVVSILVIVIAAAIYTTLVKPKTKQPKTKQPKTLEPPEARQIRYPLSISCAASGNDANSYVP